MIDIEKIRADVPSCQDSLFLNSAGSSLPPAVVNQTIIDYLQEEERIGGYKLMDIKADDIAGFYSSSAKLIHATSRNMAFVSSATDAYARALSSILFSEGDIILTSDNDYISNFIQFDMLKKRNGVRIKRIKSLQNGDLDIEDLHQLMEQEIPKLVAISHIPTNSGLIQDAQAVGKICKEYGVLYLLDACQSVGQLEVNVQDLGCDFLSMTGRKFMRAPRGTGFLYVADSLLDKGYAPMMMDSYGAEWIGTMDFKLKESARRFELWEKSDALKLGMKAAIDYAMDIGMSNIEMYNSTIREHLLSKLAGIPEVCILDLGTHKANIITLVKTGISQQQFIQHLDKHEVIFSVTSRQSALIDFDKKKEDWAIRLSPHYFNTIAEMDRIAQIIYEL